MHAKMQRNTRQNRKGIECRQEGIYDISVQQCLLLIYIKNIRLYLPYNY